MIDDCRFVELLRSFDDMLRRGRRDRIPSIINHRSPITNHQSPIQAILRWPHGSSDNIFKNFRKISPSDCGGSTYHGRFPGRPGKLAQPLNNDSEVHGMPGVAIILGAADYVLNPEEIADILKEIEMYCLNN